MVVYLLPITVNVTPDQCFTEFGKHTFCLESVLLLYKVCDMHMHDVERLMRL